MVSQDGLTVLLGSTNSPAVWVCQVQRPEEFPGTETQVVMQADWAPGMEEGQMQCQQRPFQFLSGTGSWGAMGTEQGRFPREGKGRLS